MFSAAAAMTIAACSSSNPTSSSAPQYPLTATINGVQWTSSSLGAGYRSDSGPPRAYFILLSSGPLSNGQNQPNVYSVFQFNLQFAYDSVKGAVGFDTTTEWHLYDYMNISLHGQLAISYIPSGTYRAQAHVTNDTIIEGTLDGTFHNADQWSDSIVITNSSFRASGLLHP